MEIIDISVPLQPDMPVWPDTEGVRITPTARLRSGDPANSSKLECGLHAGTHVDAPWHFLEEGDTVERLSLDAMIGSALVVYLPDVDSISARDLAGLVPAGTTRLLLRTRNSQLWADKVAEFRPDYVALTPDAAEWIVKEGVRLLGIDYLSVQRYGDSSSTHRILLQKRVVILEGLNLAYVEPGDYDLICLPLYLVGAEGAPARAVLIKR